MVKNYKRDRITYEGDYLTPYLDLIKDAMIRKVEVSEETIYKVKDNEEELSKIFTPFSKVVKNLDDLKMMKVLIKCFINDAKT